MRRIFTVPDGIHSDAHPDYEAGRIDQLDADEREARILAFGAIRRAVEVARHHECEARIIELGATDFAKRLAAEHFCLAKAVRRAIRAAIGSDKA